MLDITNDDAEICVVGRTEFWSGIGAVAYAACELLARSFPVCILPTDQPPLGAMEVMLPNGRPIPICRDPSAIRVWFYTDVLWNGAHDLKFTLIPDHGLRIAHIAYDSDELPGKWVQILNERFDMALFSSRHLEAVAVTSGVEIPVGTLPIGLNIEDALARTLPLPPGRKVRFGSLAAWHERKDNETLLEAFLEEFGGDESVELVLHSNLLIGNAYEQVMKRIEAYQANNVLASHEHRTLAQKEGLLDTIDILASCSRGEGYSIAPREALARGRVLALSDIGAHKDLMGVPGVFAIPASSALPARYTEIDHQVFGRQMRVERGDVRRVLRQAYEYHTSRPDDDGVRLRKQRAAEFSFSALAPAYAAVVNPQLRNFRTNARWSSFVHLPAPRNDPGRLGSHARTLKTRNWVVVPAHDGGFFSVFNVFMSHLVWESMEDRCQLVIPDWDVARLLERSGPPESFCYGRPGQDGNVWCSLFEPLYGLSQRDMNDAGLFERKGVRPQSMWNEHREPLLTYIHAYHLYQSPTFQHFRRQYHTMLADHVRPVPELAAEIDTMTGGFAGRFMIAAHVKHPSHVVEQPGGSLAATDTYLERIAQVAAQRGFDDSSADWGVFLATDQDAVVTQFQQRFAERLAVFSDVRRTTVEEDARFQALPAADQGRVGHQVQHLVASSPDQWSVRMAWEVVRDAYAMAGCNVLLHVVSNVSTAVAYLNPELEMLFQRPAAA